MTSCIFFAQGICRNGNSCKFIHDAGTNTTQVDLALPAVERLNLNPAVVISTKEKDKPAQTCRFFLERKCNKGEWCRFAHPPAILSPEQDHPNATFAEFSESLPDPGATIPCIFISRPGGCQKSSCPYLHVTESEHNAEIRSSRDLEEQEGEDDFIRSFSGATVYFNNYGHVLKVSFATDFSLACITGLEPGTTPEAIVDILQGLGFNITADYVRILKAVVPSELKATVKVEDPLFAKNLSSTLRKHESVLSAAPIPINAQHTNCRKVYISWHKSTRSAWVNFGSGEIANRVAQRFNEGRYKCLGRSVKSSAGKCTSSRRNPHAWTIILSDVPSDATSKSIEDAIRAQNDRPRHVELGSSSYQACDAEVSVVVRSSLEKYGPLESFYLSPINKGKRVKATAVFADEADARSACSLNNTSLDILGKGKLTVTIIQSVKIKVSSAVYIATKTQVDMISKTWRERHLALHIYPDAVHRFTTLKIEGSSAQDVSIAHKQLDRVLGGNILQAEGNNIWNSSLLSNGNTYKRLKAIEKELEVLITRDKTKRQLLYYGPEERFQQAVNRLTNTLKDESDTSNRNMEYRSVRDISSVPEEMCPICFDDEPETPIQTPCNHTYCLECFENCCKAAASTSKDEFQIKCQGNGGNCPEVFKLTELKELLSSSSFELVLESSFKTYVQRHPNDFNNCPTPDCGYIYRCTTASSSPASYTCPNCLEAICTSCRARHGEYTCAEYKDIESGGYEALQKLKKELNIKDCPKCKTSMEKTEGCNHMTCEGCGTHICWVCMDVFTTSAACYKHMNDKHGGVGLEHLYELVRW